MATDNNWLYFAATTSSPSIEIAYRCPEECSACSFPNNCTACRSGYTLRGGVCRTITSNCVQNKFIKGNICEEYCCKRCKTCNQTRTDCIECAQFYAKDESGQCV